MSGDNEGRPVMVPTAYRMIASGDAVPVFDAPNEPVFLFLHDDGTVTWREALPDD